MSMDTLVYAKLHSGASVELDDDTPSFARPLGHSRRPFKEWIAAWIGREFLAWPIWAWACLGGTTVMWRGKKFRVGLDMKVVEIKDRGKAGDSTPELERARSRSKDRQD
jgi:ceramide glucosyltransferase